MFIDGITTTTTTTSVGNGRENIVKKKKNTLTKKDKSAVERKISNLIRSRPTSVKVDDDRRVRSTCNMMVAECVRSSRRSEFT